MKLILGTVQFGLDYGISNSKGKITESEAFEILDLAFENGIDTLDTAYNYGDSEKVIGRYIADRGRKFKLISKAPKEDPREVEKIFDHSLDNLGSKNLYAYLFHDFSSFKDNPALLDKLQEFKKLGKIKKVGFSLYFTEELEYLIKNKIDFDIIQVPYSFLDQRFAKYFDELSRQGKEIHVRSVFLQGLVFKAPEDLGAQFVKIKEKMIKLRSIADESGLDIAAICLNFASLNNYIDKIVMGVESKQNLSDNVSYLSSDNETKVAKFYDELKALQEDDLNIILPINWNK